MTKILNHPYVLQAALPILTLTAQFVLASGNPKWGITINLMAQPFWIISSWKAYKQAGQSGIFINAIAFTLITMYGVLNYWLNL